jgi:ABC-type multidrug transport system fused ATPase/permease subunit
MCSTLQKILPTHLIFIIIHIALSLLAWVPVLRFLQLYTDCKICHSLLSLKTSDYQHKFLSHVLKLKAYLSFINNTQKCQIIQINILKKASYANFLWNTTWFFSVYNKSCNIQHFQDLRNAGYHNILDIRFLYVIHIFLYLATSWTDPTIKFVTWYPVLSMPRFLSLFITTHITEYMYNPKIPTGHQ